MPANSRYITSAIQSFSTFLKHKDVSHDVHEEAVLAFMRVLEYKNDFSSWDLDKYDVFQEKITLSTLFSPAAVSLLREFIVTYPPYQISIYLQEFLLALASEHCSHSTIKNYRSDIEQFIVFAQETEIDELLSKPKILSFLKYEQTKGLKDASIYRKLVSITQFLFWAHQTGATQQDGGWVNKLKTNFSVFLASNLKDLAASTPQKTEIEPHNALSPGEDTFDSSSPPKTGFTKHFTTLLPKTAKPVIQPPRLNTEKNARQLQEYRTQLHNQLSRLSNKVASKTPGRLLTYFNLALIALLVTGAAYFAYAQFFSNANRPLAYPDTPTAPYRSLSFQGRLTDTAQNPITTATDMSFKLFDAPSGGAELWDSTTCSITPDQDGIFSVGLGDECGTEITEDVFSENASVYLEVTIEAETLDPRQPIKAVAYALNSETLQGYPIDASGAATVSTVVTMNQYGEVVLGEISPKLKSVSGTFSIEAQALTLQTTSGSNGDINLSPDGTGEINLNADTIIDGYLYAPGATLSATYAGGTALILRGGPSATADIMRWQNAANSVLGVIDEAGNLGVGTSNPGYKLEVGGTMNVTGNATFEANTFFGNASSDTVSFTARVATSILPSLSGSFSLGSSSQRWNQLFTSNNGIRIGADLNDATISYDGNNLSFDPDSNSTIDVIFNDSGNVGIGTTLASQKLHVEGDFQLTGAFYDSGVDAGTPGYILSSTGSGTDWLDPATISAAANFWEISNGALYPKNSTTDLLIGGTATDSAKFAFINVDSGTPTASISAGTSGATTLTATGILGTTAMQNFTLGNATTGNLSFAPAGSTAMTILQNGNVGVGTTNPSTKLDVWGTVKASYDSSNYVAMYHNSFNPTIAFAGANGFIFNSISGTKRVMPAENGTYDLGTDTSTWATVYSNNFRSIDGLAIGNSYLYTSIPSDGALIEGNVGIGTSNPTQKLHVAGNLRLTGAFYDTSNDPGTNTYVLTSTATGTDWVDPATLGTNYWQRIAGNLSPVNLNDTISATTSAATAMTLTQTGAFNALLVEDQASDTSPFVIAQDGNVGIGTTGSSYKLRVESGSDTATAISARGNIEATDRFILTHGVANGGYYFPDGSYINTNGGINFNYSSGAPYLAFQSNGSEVVRFISDGNVGIGTTSPDFKLQVNGTIAPETTDQDLGSSSLRWDLFANTINADSTVTLTGLGTGTDNTVLILDGSNNVTTDEIDPRVWGSTLIDGSGTANRVTYWTDTDTVAADDDFFFNGTNVGIGTTTVTSYRLNVNGDVNLSSGFDYYVNGIGLNDNGSTSSGASLVGLFDDSMTYISSNTNVQSAIKQLDTAIGTVSGSNYWQRVAGNLSPITTSDTISATSSASTVATFTSTGTNDAFRAGSATDYLYIDSGGNLVPSNDVTMNLGESELRFNELFIGGGTIDMGTDGDSGLFGYNTASDYFSFDPDNDATAEFVMTDTGNLGVGSVTPGQAIDVVGNVRSSSQFLASDGSAAAPGFAFSSGAGRGMFFESGRLNFVNSSTTGFFLDNGLNFVWNENGSGTRTFTLSPSNGQTADTFIFKQNPNQGSATLFGIGGKGNVSILPDTASVVPLTITAASAQSADFLAINANGGSGGDIFGISSAGNVGIGSASPGMKLDVNGDIRAASGSDFYVGSIGLNDNSTTSSGASLIGLNDDSMAYISSNTNVQSAIKQLDTALGTVSGNNYWQRIAGNISPLNLNDTISATTSAATAMTVTQTGAFNALLVEDAASDASPFIIDQAGNVGVGTTTTAGKLDVSGIFRSTYVGSSTAIEVFGTDRLIGSSGGGHVGLAGSSISVGQNLNVPSNGSIFTTTGGDTSSGSYAFYARNSALTDLMVIQNNGNIGVGTTAAANKVHLYGTDGEFGISMTNTDSSGDRSIFNALTTDAGSAYWGLTGNAGRILSPTGAGDLAFSNRAGGAIMFSADTAYTEAQLTILETGNIGINTATPTQKLDVNGTVRLRSTLYDENNSVGTPGQVLSTTATGVDWIDAGGGTIDGSGTANYLARWTDTDTLGIGVTYDNGTNVGIGTTTLPTKLTIVGSENNTQVGAGAASSIRLQNTNQSSGNILSEISFATNGSSNFAAISGAFTDGGGNTAGNLLFSTRTATGDTDLSEKMRILANGNIGINSTAPTAKLDVTGNAVVSGNVSIGTTNQSAKLTVLGNENNTQVGAAAASLIRLINTNQSSAGIVSDIQFGFNNNGGYAAISGIAIDTGGTYGAGDIAFSTRATPSAANVTENLRIARTGNVGVGSTNPAAKLDVAGNGVFTGNISVGTTDQHAKLHLQGSEANNQVGAAAASAIRLQNTDQSAGGRIAELQFSTAGNTKYAAISGAFNDGSTNTTGNLYFSTRNSTADANLTERMTILNTGNIGIGSLTPGMKLDVNGDIRAASGSDFYVGSIGLNDNASTSSGASLIGLFDDSMAYISGNTTVQSAIKQLDTAIGGVVAGSTSWNNILAPTGNLSLAMDADTTSFSYNTLTSGTGWSLNSSATAFTGTLSDITLSGSNAANTGTLLAINNTGTSNANTSMLINHYATGTNNLALRVNDVSGDTTPFIIDGTGNVGVGTTSISEKLTIEGNVLFTTGANRTLGVADVSSGNGYNLEVSAADTSAVSGVGGNLSLFAGSASAIGTTTGGNVLIGAGSAAPDLGTGGNVYIYGGSAFDDGHVFLAHDGSGALGNVSIGTTGTTEKLTVDGNILVNRFIDTSGSGSYFLDPAAGTTSLVVAGNIGIASTSPAFALDVNGTFRASGASQFDGNVTLGNATTDQVVFTGRVNSDILPITDGDYDLGSSALRWNALYVKGASIHLGDAGNESILGYSGTEITFDANGDSTPDYSISDTGNTTTSGWVRGDDVIIGGRDGETGCSNFTNVVCGATDLWLGTDGGSIYFEDAVNANDKNITNIDNVQLDNNIGIGTTNVSTARLYVRGAVATGQQIEDATSYGLRITNLASDAIGARIDTSGTSGTGITVSSAGIAGEFTSSGSHAIYGSGSWRGNAVIDTDGANNQTKTITTRGLMYDLRKSTGTTDTATTTTWNITGLSDVDGSFAFIQTVTSKGVTAAARQQSVVVQLNGTQISIVQTANGTGASTVREAYIVARSNSEWHLAAGQISAINADLSEWLAYTGTTPVAGQIMSLVDNTSGEISSREYQPALAGVVSTAPHTTMGPESSNSIPLALAGRVPVIVTTNNGQIKPGDYITSSRYGGTGMKARFAGQVVGKAMESTESWATASCPAVSDVNSIAWPEDDGTNPTKPCFTLPNGDIVGKIMMLIDNSWFEGNINIDEAGQIMIADADSDYEVTEVGSANPITRISAFGQAIIGQVRAGLVNTKDLVVEETANIANLSVESLQINGQSLADYIATVVGNGQSATNNTQMTNEQLATTVQLEEDEIFEIQNSENDVVASIDSVGNATFSGQLSSRLALLEQLQTDNVIATTATVSGTTSLGSLLTDTASVAGTLTAQDASITGTLTAGSARLELLEGRVAELQSIKAQTAELMDATISGTLYAENIADFENRVNQAINQPSLLQALLNQLPQNPAPPESVIPPIEDGGYIATGAGELNLTLEDLALESDDVALLPTAVFIDQYLKVNGIAYVADQLGVGNQLLIGDGLQLGDGTIAYTPSTTESPLFKIQPSGRGTLELMAGLMTLDESGTVTVTGNLAVAGNLSVQDTLLTDLLQPTDFGNPFQVQVAGLSTESGQIKQSRFEIVNEYRVPVATISAGGRAEFADGIGIGSEDLGQGGTLNSSQSSGRATIGANSLEVIINSTKITPNSLIYITPVGSTNNSVMYLKSQTPENSNTSEKEGQFVVGFDEILDRDVTFNWWIVN